jgi:riboflavin synthase
MFTGLVEATGQFRSLTRQAGSARMAVSVRWPDAGPSGTRIGDSVAVNGACLTVVALDPQPAGETLTFDLSHETLALTAFPDLASGDAVNLERALKLGDRLGGHIVSGHVDGVATLVRKVANGPAWDLTYRVSPELEPEIVTKGSITVDGVSLTVNSTPAGHFTVTLIPHTSVATQLLTGREGKRVHLETDLLARYVRRLLEFGVGPTASGSRVDMDLLDRSGFLAPRGY